MTSGGFVYYGMLYTQNSVRKSRIEILDNSVAPQELKFSQRCSGICHTDKCNNTSCNAHPIKEKL